MARFSPAALTVLSVVGTAYLLWLAYRIAAAPVGAPAVVRPAGFSSTVGGGFLLGVTNPKAYIAFASLMASYVTVHANPRADFALKWTSCLVIVFLVDVVWLWVGAMVGKADLSPLGERVLNLSMGSTVLVTALVAWI
jgi:threonine/homoserine/homoserine lactone efflux protein